VDVVAALSAIDWMPDFPAEERRMTVFARCIASFAQTVEVNHTNPEYPDPADLGWVNPLEWLVGEVAASCIRFPAPIIWRRLYEAKFQPLDGRTADQLSSNVKG
jgi:hypothetical protein